MPGGIFPHGSTVTFGGVEVGGLLDIPLPEDIRDEVETTSMDSGGRRTFVGGLRDGGTLTLEMRMLPGDPGQTALRANYEEPGTIIEEVVITLPESVLDSGFDQLAWTFDAWVMQAGGNLPWENTAASRTVQLRVVSDPVETVATAAES